MRAWARGAAPVRGEPRTPSTPWSPRAWARSAFHTHLCGRCLAWPSTPGRASARSFRRARPARGPAQSPNVVSPPQSTQRGARVSALPSGRREKQVRSPGSAPAPQYASRRTRTEHRAPRRSSAQGLRGAAWGMLTATASSAAVAAARPWTLTCCGASPGLTAPGGIANRSRCTSNPPAPSSAATSTSRASRVHMCASGGAGPAMPLDSTTGSAGPQVPDVVSHRGRRAPLQSPGAAHGSRWCAPGSLRAQWQTLECRGFAQGSECCGGHAPWSSVCTGARAGQQRTRDGIAQRPRPRGSGPAPQARSAGAAVLPAARAGQRSWSAHARQ